MKCGVPTMLLIKPRVFIDFPLDQLDKALIGHLGLSICLGIV
jgi:hypothetical protein